MKESDMSRPPHDHDHEVERQRERGRRESRSRPPPPQEEDCLSKLPDDILIRIISLLPVKDRLTTSALSRRWRHLWTLVPSLDFPRCDDDDSRPDPATYLRTLGNLLHLYHAHAPEGRHLSRFYAHIYGNPDPRQLGGELSRCIEIAALRSIRELSLSFEDSSAALTRLSLGCILPCARALRVLRLQDCILGRLPLRLGQEERFPRLETLVLVGVDIADDVLGALLAICPGLESLEISECRCLRSIDVSNPRLRDLVIELPSYGEHLPVSLALDLPELRLFHFCGVLQKVQWKVLPRLLSEAQLELTGRCCSSIWPHFHEAFSVVEVLSASSAFFQYSPSIISKNLKELHCIKLECHRSFLPFLSYLNECPRLEELFITLYHGRRDDSSLAPAEVDYNVNLTSDASCSKWSWNFAIRKIIIMGLTNEEPEIHLAKFLLRKTQLLEQLTLVYDICSCCVHEIAEEALKEFRDCSTASPSFTIVIESSEDC